MVYGFDDGIHVEIEVELRGVRKVEGVGPGQARPSRTEQSKAEQSRTEQSQVGSGRVESDRIGLDRTVVRIGGYVTSGTCLTHGISFSPFTILLCFT